VGKAWKERVKYAIGTEGSSMIYMAGIYRKEGNRAVCTILTRDPAAEISFIHNRMPVILPAEAVSDWLNIRYDATDVLRSAMLNMEYRPA
jgi:putative SOS response-associated peptidase YedK